MKKTALSEFKAKLSKFIRLVKAGEVIEIQERGVPVALLSSVRQEPGVSITPPRSDPKGLSKIKSTVKLKKDIDIVKLLREDRDKR